jgi:hypothetical protein
MRTLRPFTDAPEGGQIWKLPTAFSMARPAPSKVNVPGAAAKLT